MSLNAKLYLIAPTLTAVALFGLLATSPLAGQQPLPSPPQGIDGLTAPIALYPDALVAQILMAATNVSSLQSFAAWMGKNANLKGSELQAAADQVGFDACYIALAPFPQVVQMMAGKLDWTTNLGQAFTKNKDAVFDSIQRLRAQAKAVGNLATTPQQEVQTQTTAAGQQVIVIQPANPQVIYVPQYNPQTVYVTAPPPAPAGPSPAAAAAVGFTVGIIIGHASTPYYHGPYAWHGASLYHEAWEDRYDYLEDRQDDRQDYMDDRQDRYQESSQQRQSNAQANQSERQSTAQTNQSQRQSTAQTNQSQRQSTAQASQSQRQSTAQASQGQAQSNQAQRQTQAQNSAGAAQASRQPQQAQRQSAAVTSSHASGQTASQRSGTRSGGFSGYQSGGATRTQSSRGSKSLSSSRSGGRRR
jgi:hypothetical protein